MLAFKISSKGSMPLEARVAHRSNVRTLGVPFFLPPVFGDPAGFPITNSKVDKMNQQRDENAAI